MDPLPIEIVQRLGRVPDATLAKEAGCNVETIRRARLRADIPAFKYYTKWTAEMDALLGTAPDAEIAEVLGTTRQSVLLRRQRRGIPPFVAQHLSYLKGPGNSTTGVATLTAHVSEECRNKANALRIPLLAKFRATGLPMRDISMWQVMEFAIEKLYAEMIGAKTETPQ